MTPFMVPRAPQHFDEEPDPRPHIEEFDGRHPALAFTAQFGPHVVEDNKEFPFIETSGREPFISFKQPPPIGGTFVVVLTDTDWPTRGLANRAELCHWIGCYSGDTEKLKHTDLVPYHDIEPPPKGGAHRYLFRVFTAHEGAKLPKFSRTWKRDCFNPMEWAKDHGFKFVGAKMFICEDTKGKGQGKDSGESERRISSAVEELGD